MLDEDIKAAIDELYEEAKRGIHFYMYKRPYLVSKKFGYFQLNFDERGLGVCVEIDGFIKEKDDCELYEQYAKLKEIRNADVDLRQYSAFSCYDCIISRNGCEICDDCINNRNRCSAVLNLGSIDENGNIMTINRYRK